MVFDKTRAHLHTGICRQCYGTGEVPSEDDVGQVECPDCRGLGATR